MAAGVPPGRTLPKGVPGDQTLPKDNPGGEPPETPARPAVALNQMLAGKTGGRGGKLNIHHDSRTPA